MIKSMLSVGIDLRQLLLQDANLTALVGTNIFPLVAPEATQGDFITISREKYRFDHTKFGAYDETATVSVMAFSPNYDRSLQIAEAIRAAIVGIKVNGMYLRITDSEETLTDFTISGQAWYAQYFQVTAGSLDLG